MSDNDDGLSKSEAKPLKRSSSEDGVSYYVLELLSSAAIVFNSLYWGVSLLRDGFVVQGIVFVAQSVIGGFFLAKFFLEKRIPLFSMSLFAMVLIMVVIGFSLPAQERAILHLR